MSAYQDKPPLWIAIKVLSFGQLHLMFSLLNSKIATKVLKSFNMDSNERNQFESILYVINWLRNECAHFEMINHSTYHGKYPISKELIKKLGFRKNKTRNLNLFQCMCILDYVQPLKKEVYSLFEKSPISSELKRKYLKYIGYWRQSKWDLNY